MTPSTSGTMQAAATGELFEAGLFGRVLARLPGAGLCRRNRPEQYVSTVWELHLTPVDLKDSIVLAAATAVPLIPVVLFAAPFDVLLKEVASVLF